MFKNKKLKFITLLLVIPLIGLGCKGSGQISQDKIEGVTLNYWRVFDESDDFDEIIASFRAIYPHINVKVRKLRFEEYESAILRAIAEGESPDIISFHNTWTKAYKNILEPAPMTITLPVQQGEGRKKITVLQKIPGPSLRDLRNNFVDVVYQDAILDNQIYGLPLSLDTLILYYNRQLLNQANIAQPPLTWTDFKEQVKALTIQDGNGNIVQAGATLGTGRNINRAADILSALMLQNGTAMLNDSRSKAAFNLVPQSITEKGVAPGRDALRFYTDFASPAKEVYTWNSDMPESIQAFTSQKAAFFFGYAYHLPTIRSLAPGLDLGITKLPQISTGARPVNFANYWLEGVPKQSKHKTEAWAFIQFAADSKNVVSFLSNAKKPTALRVLIAGQRENDELINFVDQVLTAQSWYQGRDAATAEETFRVMIDQVGSGELSADEAINDAAQKISNTL